MGTAFRDIELRLTEASLVVDQMTPQELALLLAEAAGAIADLRAELSEAQDFRASRDGSRPDPVLRD